MRKLEVKQVSIRKAKSAIVAVVPIHGADVDLWLEQLFTEFDRLDWEVVWHINDMPNPEHSQRIISYSRTIGYSIATNPSVPFIDEDRNYAWKIAEESGAPWISLHDSDETYEPQASELLFPLLEQRCIHVMPWCNVWKIDEEGRVWIRVDKPFLGRRPRLYPIGPWKYTFRSTTASPYATSNRWPAIHETGVRILHWGFSNQELRERHYKRWHGKVNSGWWEMVMTLDDKLRLKQFDPTITHAEWKPKPYVLDY